MIFNGQRPDITETTDRGVFYGYFDRNALQTHNGERVVAENLSIWRIVFEQKSGNVTRTLFPNCSSLFQFAWRDRDVLNYGYESSFYVEITSGSVFELRPMPNPNLMLDDGVRQIVNIVKPNRTEVRRFLKVNKIPLSFLPNSSSSNTILFDFAQWQNLYPLMPKDTEKAFEKLKRVLKKNKKYKLVHIPTWGYQLEYKKK